MRDQFRDFCYDVVHVHLCLNEFYHNVLFREHEDIPKDGVPLVIAWKKCSHCRISPSHLIGEHPAFGSSLVREPEFIL
jgi:hypothetical protein